MAILRSSPLNRSAVRVSAGRGPRTVAEVNAVWASAPDLGFPDVAQWLTTAQAQIDNADRVARAHQPDYGMCTCSRPLPWVQLDSALRRRSEVEAAVSVLLGPTLVLPVIVSVQPLSPAGQRRWSRFRSWLELGRLAMGILWLWLSRKRRRAW